MNSAKEQVTEWKREKLRELLSQCTDAQIGIFNRMYKSIDAITNDKMDWAMEQCLRTVEKNNLGTS